MSREKKGAAAAADDPLATPVMRQYLELKRGLDDAILLFRMGDFYELFLEDAERAAPIMDVALTRRQSSIPMCGVPYHSVETYVQRLIAAGCKVAIAEQQPDPENPRLMQRRLQRVITAGTLVEEGLLASSANNYLMAFAVAGDNLGLALADVSTGDFFASAVACGQGPASDDTAPRSGEMLLATALRDWISQYAPREILSPSDRLQLRTLAAPEGRAIWQPMEPWKASPSEGLRQLETRYAVRARGLGFEDPASPALGALSLILHYVRTNFPGQTLFLQAPAFREGPGACLRLDEQTIRHLELTENQQDGGPQRTLFSTLDRCKTPVGKRALRAAILAPFRNIAEIQARANRVEQLLGNDGLRSALSAALDGVQDLERALARQAAGRGAPRDFVIARQAIVAAQSIAAATAGAGGGWLEVTASIATLAEDLQRIVVDSPPAVFGGGALVRDGVDAELDRARQAQQQGGQWILDFEERERKRSGLNALRVKYNRVYGYFIEISKGQAKDAPQDYTRKQTLTGYERFSNDELAEMEATLLGAEERIQLAEERIAGELSHRLLAESGALKQLMQALGETDLRLALAEVAARGDWQRPQCVASGAACLEIDDGRHPVVEEHLPRGDLFTPNSVRLLAAERSFAVLTGPNMAGKSTYIRQIALIQLLAQMGSYVPAQNCRLSLCDRIFTRIGAGDNLTRGESTFFVEMLETARILNQCSSQSLVIMDEVGRGTSTYDGMSIAWAIVERLSDPEGPLPLTLFATHYHELTALGEREKVINLTMDVQERDGRVLFLHRVREGAADRSYGIHVARLAGMPEAVLRRAEEKLIELERELDRSRQQEAEQHSSRRGRTRRAADGNQSSLFS
ncbi:MAG: DNA mismatch repair protein MutS [Leptospirales bacterium]|nr:DNA mismatch repair protein MutS [Leptospirales bacterium]